MKNSTDRVASLDNIRNLLVYNVVFYHVIAGFAYPLVFYWPVLDKAASSRLYETAIMAMGVYLMPCLLFIAALFIFPSLKKEGVLVYLKKRFLRLCVPVIVYVFCAGDVFVHLLLKRLNSNVLEYRETFLRFWRAFADMPALYMTSSEKSLNTVTFSYNHTWFLPLLFLLTVAVVLVSRLFKRRADRHIEEDNTDVGSDTFAFGVLITVIYAAAMIYLSSQGINQTWTTIGKIVSFDLYQIWILIPLFLFGLAAYRKGWLHKDHIGNWKMWGGWSVLFLGAYSLFSYFYFMPGVEEIVKVIENHMVFDGKMAMPVLTERFKFATLCTWVFLTPACVSLLMFFCSFAKRFFNRPNAITTFCSKHSINVYILHFIPVLIMHQALFNAPVPSFVKILLITAVVIPACLWLSHRLVYPYPKTAIGFFVALKGVALAAGFTFYYYALLALILISFAGAVCEGAMFWWARKSCIEPAPCAVGQDIDGAQS